jgi:hypothetical protein
LDDKPFKHLEAQADGLKAALDIPRRRGSAVESQAPENEGITAKVSNGVSDPANVGITKKRAAADALEDDSPDPKRGRTAQPGETGDDGNTINLDDETNSTIIIDD